MKMEKKKIRIGELVELAQFDLHDRENEGGSRLPPSSDPPLLRNALAFHPFQQLREVPDLLFGADLTIGEIRRPILQIEGAGPQIQAAGQLGDEAVELGASFLAERLAALKAGVGGVQIVDVGPIRTQPLKRGSEGAVHGRLNVAQIERPPVEVRNTKAD